MDQPLQTVREQLVPDADHVALERLVTEVTWRIDHGRAESISELFVSEGIMDLGETRLQGREAIHPWGILLQTDNTYPGIRHVSTNMRFVLEGNDKARGTCLVTAYVDEADGPGSTLPLVVGEDHDTFVRTEEGWRFLSRTWDPLFFRQADSTPREANDA